MNKVICNSIDYIFHGWTAVMTPDHVELKPGYDWKNLPVREKPVYASEITREDAGPLRKQTVTAITRYDVDPLLKEYTAYPVILRLRTDSNVFYAGSYRFPCTIEVSDDGITETWTFTSTSIP